LSTQWIGSKEIPLFDAPGEHGLITQDSDVTTPIEYKDEVPDDDVFIISQEDFEKEYEVQ
jgi:hypothetical protein